jgi:alpha-L-fucosidase
MRAAPSTGIALAAVAAALVAGAAAPRAEVASVASVAPPAPVGPVPSARQLAWHEMAYYGFVHFTVNTFTDKEWGYGDESPDVFAPSAFDAAQWARTAKAAGMAGLILTAKHHDGFCLWPSRLSDHTVAQSRWRDGKADVVREFVDACRREGLAAGLYLSPWDRNRADYARPSYLDYYRGQLRELLTGYGPLFEVWFDGANGGDGYYGGAREKRKIDGATYYEWPKTWGLVRELQPSAVMFSDAGPDVRWVGNESGLGFETTWMGLDRRALYPGAPDYQKLAPGQPDAAEWVPPEVDVSIRPGWFYHPAEDAKVKTVAQLVDIYYASVGRSANLLLNVPPDRRGLFHETDVERLRGLRAYLDATFGHDLARGAKATADATRGGGSPSFAPARAVDGDASTYWATDDGVTAGTLQLELAAPARFDQVRVREAIALGQRVEGWALDALVDGGWKTLAEGTTVGVRRILRFPPVTASRVRLRVTRARACPAIAELALFLSAPL